MINKQNSVVSMAERYIGQYLIIERDIYINGRYHAKVKCPCCNKERFIRQTLLQDNNKDKVSSTICQKCTGKTIRIFYYDDKRNYAYSYLNGEKLIIDIEDVSKVEWLNLMLDIHKHVVINISKQRTIPLHRFLLNVHNNKEVKCVDHINHNPLDNRKINLRTATFSQNSHNLFVTSKNKTGFKNIYYYNDKYHKQKWIVQFNVEHKRFSKKFYNFYEAYCFWYDTMRKEHNDFAYNILNDATKNLRFAAIQQNDIANGEGIGEVLFTQFCSHHCKNCHNPETWSSNGGYKFTQKYFDIVMKYFENNPQANRLTLSGGDPLENLYISNLVSAEFKRRYPNKRLWIYTGYNFEELINDIKYKAILELCDVLVDGAYVDELRNLTLQFKGSSNQRIIDVQKSLAENKVILWQSN